MCGISGLIGYKGDAKAFIHKMNEHMKDRGPDAEGIWWSREDETLGTDCPGVCLGHRRLAILDLTTAGAQPFTSASGRMVIVFNGEIYNHQEIRKKLLADGHVKAFRSTCDTETIVEAAEAYGIDETLQMAKGMFAIAIYDKRKQTLTLFRDRVGQKPLYFGWLDGLGEEGSRGGAAFAFCSDLGAFREIEGFRNEIRREVLDQYFIHGYIPAPYSIYEHIWKLEPGMILELSAPFGRIDLPEVLAADLQKAGGKTSGDGYEMRCYWSMREVAEYGQSHLFTGSRQEAADILEEKLSSAIKDMMIADVPLGAFLSAGIDSSTIVSLMHKVNPGKVKTYTIGLEGGYDEAPIAKEIAEHLGVENTQMYIKDTDAKAVIPLLAEMFGEPFADSSQLPTYLVSKLTRQHVTVSLSGDAGDELFCGYRSYESLDRIWNKMKNVPYGLRNAAGSILLHTPAAKKELLNHKAELLRAKGPISLGMIQDRIEADAGQIARHRSNLPMKEALLGDDCMPEFTHAAMLRDLTLYHPDDILVKVDRTAMAVSLETRVPFLDRDVVEFAWSLPIDYLRSIDEKGQGGTSGSFTGKLVLRDILYQYVPKTLMDRPKKGFSIPIRRWLKEGDLREWAEDLLDEQRLREEGFLDADQVRSLWNDFIVNDRWRQQIWYILMFENWLRTVS